MRHPEITIPVASLAAVILMMLAELTRSHRNERALRSRGAIEPEGDVYRPLAFFYPAMFVAMAVEGALAGPAGGWMVIIGFAVFVAAKLLKLWAIASLGQRWSYRVLVLPNAPLVTAGPYAHLRHPNYVAVFGEIAGFAMMVDAQWTGTGSLLLFGLLVRRRIAIEESALGMTTAATHTTEPGSRIPDPD